VAECFLECQQELTRLGGFRQKSKDDTEERKTATLMGFGWLVGWFGLVVLVIPKGVHWPSKRRRMVLVVLRILAARIFWTFPPSWCG